MRLASLSKALKGPTSRIGLFVSTMLVLVPRTLVVVAVAASAGVEDVEASVIEVAAVVDVAVALAIVVVEAAVGVEASVTVADVAEEDLPIVVDLVTFLVPRSPSESTTDLESCLFKVGSCMGTPGYGVPKGTSLLV